MITVPEASLKVITRSRYLSEALSKGLINVSSLARYIKPEIEEMLMKDVSEASIIMAIKRLETPKIPENRYKQIFQITPDMTVRSNLFSIYFVNAKSLPDKLQKIASENNGTYFLNITAGSTESTITASGQLHKKIKSILKGENVIAEYRNLSAITLKLPKEAIEIPGIYYFFLKSLAWEEINLREVVSTYQEMTLIFDDKDVNRAFFVRLIWQRALARPMKF